MPILYTTHNHVHSTRTYRIRNPSAPPFLRVSHSRNSSRRHSTRTSPASGNPSLPTFYPGVSLPESLYVAISSRCLTPGIPLRRHSTRVSHSQNSSPPPFHPDALHPESNPPTFHLSRVSHARNPIRRRSTFFFILRAFSLGSKITFLIKLCCHFYFWQAIFHTSSVFKMF